MWQTAKLCERQGQSPSQRLRTDEQYGEWWAWCLDEAIAYFVLLIENALAERKEVQIGNRKELQPVYTLQQLLIAGFLLPRPETRRPTLLEAAGNSGGMIKVWPKATPRPSET